MKHLEHFNTDQNIFPILLQIADGVRKWTKLHKGIS